MNLNIDHKFAFAWNVENARVSVDRTDSIPILINMKKLCGAAAATAVAAVVVTNHTKVVHQEFAFHSILHTA